jgi:hypothetical protein
MNPGRPVKSILADVSLAQIKLFRKPAIWKAENQSERYGSMEWPGMANFLAFLSHFGVFVTCYFGQWEKILW